jgi:hypothetical protein
MGHAMCIPSWGRGAAAAAADRLLAEDGFPILTEEDAKPILDED